MKFSTGFIFAMMLLILPGCSPRTSIATIRISDEEVGLLIDVPVQRNGTFSKETKTEGYVTVASGTISDDTAGVSSVKLVYDRRLRLAAGGTRAEKIETTFTAQPGVEVAFGKNPSEPDAAGNATANVTVTLLKRK
jgi:hypothetical protein